VARGYAFDKNFIYNLKLICIFDPEKSRYQYEKIVFRRFFADISNHCELLADYGIEAGAGENYELQCPTLRGNGFGCGL